MVTGARDSSSYPERNWSLSTELAAVTISSDDNRDTVVRPPQPKLQAFEWIPHGDASARKRARAHVTRGFRRQQKEAAQALLRGDTKDEAKVAVAARNGSSSSDSETEAVFVSSGSSATPTAHVVPAELGIPALTQNQMTISQAPGFSWPDPFAALPVSSNTDTGSLVAHFCSGVAPATFALDARASFQPIRILSFKVALADAAAFHVILSAAAHDLASLQGKPVSDQSVKYQGLALSLVNKRLSHSASLPSDDTIAATTLLAGNELLFGTPENFNKHMNGLSLMLKLRGGLKSLRKNNPLLYSLISWFDYAGSCNIVFKRRFSPKSYSQHSSQSDPDGVPTNILCSLPDRYDLYQDAVSVLKTLQMVRSTIQTGLSDDVMLSKSSSFVNRIDSDLHRSLRLPELEGTKGRRRDIQQSFYLVTLIFIGFSSSQHLNAEPGVPFVDRLEFVLACSSATWAAAITDLLRLLFAGDDEYFYCWDAYTAAVANVVDVAFTLDCSTWRAIKNALLSFFLHDEACEGRLQTLWKRRLASLVAALT